MTGLDWLRRALGPHPNTVAEIADLERQVDELATERDELADARGRLEFDVQRLTQSRNDLRRWIKAAYEPVRVGECGKLRYVHRGDAERHIIHMAPIAPGEVMNAYQCRRCPQHPGYRTLWWHAGHCRPDDDGAIALCEDGTAVYRCGCVYGPSLDAFVWRCPEHYDSGSYGEAA